MKSLMSLPNNFSTIQVDKCLQKCGGHHRWFLVSGQNLSLRPHKDPLVHDVVAMGTVGNTGVYMGTLVDGLFPR